MSQLSGPPSLPLAGGTLTGPLILSNGVALNSLPDALEYVSAEQTITAAGTLALTHGLPNGVKKVYVDLVCKTADNGFAVGAVIKDLFGAWGGGNNNLTIEATATQLLITFGDGGTTMAVIGKTTKGIVGLTNANWHIVFRAYGPGA